MTIMKGIVKNGVIIPDAGTAPLPEGAEVVINISSSEKAEGVTESVNQMFLRFAGKAKGNYPKDFARNHDHYIHGTPKRPEST